MGAFAPRSFSVHIIATDAAGSSTPSFALSSASTRSAPSAFEPITVSALPYALPVYTVITGTDASAYAFAVFADSSVILPPSASHFALYPFVSTRFRTEIPNELQRFTNAESLPPLCAGLFAATPHTTPLTVMNAVITAFALPAPSSVNLAPSATDFIRSCAS